MGNIVYAFEYYKLNQYNREGNRILPKIVIDAGHGRYTEGKDVQRVDG